MSMHVGQGLGSCHRIGVLLGLGGNRAVYAVAQGQEPGLEQTLERLPAVGLEFATLVLAFTLAIFVVLVFGVRLLMVVRKLPVPLDPLDMPKPKGFRTLMLGFAVALAPLVARGFLPTEGMDPGWALALAYALAFVVVVIAWLLLEVFYQARAKRL
jgi:hypothetical protein